MADLKISALPAATTPVGGTEVLPIVQSSTTKKVSIDSLTKGRVVNALTFDTDVAAAGVTLTGTTLAADGTDTNININLTPKGTGTVSTSGYGVSIPGANTAAILSNDANGLVVSQFGNDKVKVRGIGGVGEGTSLQVGEGAARSNPNFAFIGDPDTGIFNASAASPNKLEIIAGGAEYVSVATAATIVNDGGADHDFRVEGDTDANLLFVDASTDRVGVGTSSPAVKFDVNGAIASNSTVTGTKMLVTGGTATGNGMYLSAANELGFSTNGVLRAKINDAGVFVDNGAVSHSAFDVNIGKAAGSWNYGYIRLGQNDLFCLTWGGGASGYADTVTLANPGNNPISFATNGTVRGQITGVGEAIYGGTTDQGAYNLQCNGTAVWGAGAYVNGSDARLKDNIQSLDSGLDVVKAMRPVTFQYKPDYSKDQSVQPGFIAQELQQAMAGKPYLEGVVQEGTNHLNVAYQNIIPILVKAIQELEAEVAALKAR